MSCIYLPHTLSQSGRSLGGAPHVLSGPLSNKIYSHYIPYHGQVLTQNANKQCIRNLTLYIQNKMKIGESSIKLQELLFCADTLHIKVTCS